MRRAAWVLLAPTAALAALLPPAGAQGGQADDPVRRQAEELAEAASKKFGEVLKGEKAEPGPRRPDAAEPAPEPAPEHALGLLFYWLDYSEQQYRGIMRRLATERGGRGWDPATVGWLRRSNQEFHSIIEKLARAGGRGRPWDPVADAARRQKQAQAEPPPPAAAATPSREAAAGGGVAPEQSPGGDQARQPDASPAPAVSAAPAAKPPAEAEAGQAGDRPQGDGKEAQAAAPAAANPDSTEPPATSKLEIARGEEAAAGHRRPADGEEEEAPARPRQAPTAALDAGEEAAAARKREEPPQPALSAEPAAPEPSSGQAAQEAKAANAHSDKQVATAPRPALLAQRLQSAVARPAARGAADGSGSERCQLAGVEAELPGWYVVKKGDTLWAIAKRHYGAGRRYRSIYEANRSQLKRGPDWILPCQRLYLPPRQRGAERP